MAHVLTNPDILETAVETDIMAVERAMDCFSAMAYSSAVGFLADCNGATRPGAVPWFARNVPVYLRAGAGRRLMTSHQVRLREPRAGLTYVSSAVRREERMRARIAAALMALIVSAGLAGCAELPASPASARTDVTVIVCSGLRSSDIASGMMPAARELAEEGALGLVVTHVPEETTATLSVYASAPYGRDIHTVVVPESGRVADTRIAEVVQSTPPHAMVALVSVPTSDRPGLVVLRGGGYDNGLLLSSSTRRVGIVTDHDVAETIMNVAGRRDSADSDAVCSVDRGGLGAAERIERVAEMESFLVAMERTRIPLQSAFTVAMVVLVVVGWLLAERGRSRTRYLYWSTVTRRALLFGLCVPAGGTLLFAVERYPATGARIVALLLAASGLVWLFSQLAWHRFGTGAGIALAALATAATLVVDQVLGAPLSTSSLFSYSPVAGFRFYGLGNEGAAVLVGALLTGVALELDAVRADRRTSDRVIVLTGVVAVCVAALPFLGANSVVAVWAPVTFVALAVASRHRRVRFSDVFLAAGAVVISLGVVVMVDRLMPGATHVTRALDSGPSGMLDVVVRRAETSLRIFTETPITAIACLVVIGFVYMVAHPRGRMAAVFKRYPTFHGAVIAGLVGGTVGMVVEDSGVAILGLMLLYLAGALVMLMLAPDADEREVAR
ncbi:MAG: hypothetical protein LLG24_09070 [Actinomycetia bacterium]|nr:hypothetical protein [Actinomycetes bacterium]